MSTARTRGARVWFLTAVSVLLSVASAFSCLMYMDWPADWRVAGAICLAGSIAAGTFALPLYANASRVSRFIARFILASILSMSLTVTVGIVAVSIITASHQASDRKLGDTVISKVEEFRRTKGRLPDSLSEAGIEGDESCPCYCKTGDNSYIVWNGTTLGESDTYDSQTKKWSEEGQGVCAR